IQRQQRHKASDPTLSDEQPESFAEVSGEIVIFYVSAKTGADRARMVWRKIQSRGAGAQLLFPIGQLGIPNFLDQYLALPKSKVCILHPRFGEIDNVPLSESSVKLC